MHDASCSLSPFSLPPSAQTQGREARPVRDDGVRRSSTLVRYGSEYHKSPRPVPNEPESVLDPPSTSSYGMDVLETFLWKVEGLLDGSKSMHWDIVVYCLFWACRCFTFVRELSLPGRRSLVTRRGV